jgi:hypothetical protein
MSYFGFIRGLLRATYGTRRSNAAIPAEGGQPVILEGPRRRFTVFM